MPTAENFDKKMRLKAVVVYTVALAIFLNRFFSRALLPQIGEALTDTAQPELVYGILSKTGIVIFFLKHHWVSAVFDISLFFTPVFYLVFRKRVFAVAFTVLVIFYFLAFNITAFHHYHGLFAIVVISIPFWTKNETRFNFLWEAVRYYWIYIFSSAALWKILRGSLFYQEQLSNILKQQQVDLLLQQPESIRAVFVRHLISNPEVSHAVLLLNVAVQLFFVVGFFTKRFDPVLFALAIIFCTANYLVMNIISVELLILNLTLVNWSEINQRFVRLY